jgi:uncharacterized DUF497 family protein
MREQFSGFDWDDGNRAKCQKHSVAIEAIESLFCRVMHVAPDPAHSLKEERLKAIGVTGEGRHVLVVFTLRQRGVDTLIRPVSARYMHRKEVEHYEKETSKTEK